MIHRWFLGIGLFLLFAAVQLPASMLAPWVSEATSQRWRLSGVEGTLWHGRAVLSGIDRASGRWQPGPHFQWRIAGAELLRGRLVLQIHQDGGGSARMVASLPAWRIAELDVGLPVSHIASLLPGTLGEYGWAGTARLGGKEFSCRWSRLHCMGQLDLQWANAAVAQLPGPVLGDVRVRVVGEGEALRIDLVTLRGRLHMSGTGELTAEVLRFSAEAEARGEGAAGLEAVLKAVGRPGTTPGRYLIDYREKLR